MKTSRVEGRRGFVCTIVYVYETLAIAEGNWGSVYVDTSGHRPHRGQGPHGVRERARANNSRRSQAV